ncbi:MAG TPA: PBP1A family penicillin-binding protein [Clostridia bacterium]|jgi:penicillin-binding protein 1A|nr:PBP1A family penicillin-binding protein [Clostridia bacterium]
MPKKRKKAIRKVNVWRLVIVILLFLFIVGAGIGAGFVIGALKAMPSWQPGDITGDMTTTFYDNEGNLIGERHGVENRIPVDIDQVPQHLINAFIATEDPNFKKHHGIDYKAILRAVYANIKDGWGAQGGSTITIQLAKNAFIDQEARSQKKLERKIQEAFLALQLERTYTKEEILEFYLNQIPFGRGAYGVQAAAKTFFDKDVEELTLAECALIAGLTQRPAAYDPFKHPEAAKGRRARVLANMVEHGYITQTEADKANAEEFKLSEKPQQVIKTKYAYFIDHVIEEAENILEANDIPASKVYNGGYKIYTTMNTTVQTKIEEVYSDSKNFPEDMNGELIQSSMVVLNPHTGEIVGLIGGRDYTTQRGLNRATQMKRSPGSTIKPISVYAPALEKGYSPATVVDDVPVSFGNYKPTNYDGRYRGLINLREAVKDSVNIPAVKMLNTIGVNTGFEYAKKMGLPLVEGDKNLSLALGGLTYGVSPLDLASAYGVLANKGLRVEPHAIIKIEDHNGNLLYEAKPQKTEVLTEQSAYLMTDMLQTVVKSGTATRAQMNRPVAGKTGTTQLPDKPEFRGKRGNQDAWFAGYTPELVGVVWMGFDKTDAKHYLPQVYGGRYPALIWKQVMEEALKDEPVKQFEVPEGITYAQIDKKSGLLPSELTPSMYIIREVFAKQNLPKTTSDIWIEAEVCADSGQIPSPFCFNIVSGIFMQRPIPYTGTVKPEDADLELPTIVCEFHQDGNIELPASNIDDNHWQNVPGQGNGNGVPQTPNNSPSQPNSSQQAPEAPYLYGEQEGHGVRLYWKADNSSGDLNFSVERWTENNPKRYSITITTNQTYLDQQVEEGETYYYRVFAINTNTNLSTPSNEIKVKVK